MAAWITLYGAIVSKESRRFFTYRSNIFSGLLTAFLALAVRYALWTALFAAGGAQDSTLRETMTFYIVNDLILIWVASQYSKMIGADIRSGDIATRLVKPMPYHLHLIASSHANALLSSVTRTVPGFLIALVWIGLSPPVSPSAFACFVLTAVLGMVIYTLVDLTVSYSAFWLTDYWYLQWLIRAMFSLFGGTTVPLWFYPGWLDALCAYLPFRYAVYQPMAFYLGRVPAGEIVVSLGIQLAWIAVLFTLSAWVWRRAQYKLTVQGG